MRSPQLKDEGKIRHSAYPTCPKRSRRRRAVTPIVSIQNRYNSDRTSEPIVDLCEIEKMAFLPWAPIQDGDNRRARHRHRRAASALTATGAAGLAVVALAGNAPHSRHRHG